MSVAAGSAVGERDEGPREGRSSSFEVPLDTSFFTPEQLQPVAIGRLGYNGVTRWMRDHVWSHRTLIWEHRVGIVVWAWELRYGSPLRFSDADAIKVAVSASVRGLRSQVQYDVEVTAPNGVVADMRVASIPLALAGDPSLSGVPSRLPDEIVAGFRDDEVGGAPYRSSVPALAGDIRRDGEPLGTVEEPFRIHRHNCEVADQWYWVEALGFAGTGREELVTRHAAARPELVGGLARPLERVDALCRKTYQFRDSGTVATSGYLWQDRLVFVHDLLGEDGADDVRATLVEQFR